MQLGTLIGGVFFWLALFPATQASATQQEQQHTQQLPLQQTKSKRMRSSTGPLHVHHVKIRVKCSERRANKKRQGSCTLHSPRAENWGQALAPGAARRVNKKRAVP